MKSNFSGVHIPTSPVSVFMIADDSEDYSSDQLLVFVAEILADSVAKDRGLSDDQKQSIVDVLLKPHKHKHRTAMNQKQIKKKDVEKGHIDLNKNHVDENPHEHHNGTALGNYTYTTQSRHHRTSKITVSRNNPVR